MNAYRTLVEKLVVKRSLGIHIGRCEDNRVLDHREIGWSAMDWINVAHDRDQ
jgi:hypothetical protein